ncbi:hypothetical protein ABZ897_15630 [Nonomuraea sp. NPDC046802]|uniref:hypothetical protein n=1 Tax=Nonomuraea sp. NPDC046802 TaxID=3154919 RepID=UPI0033CA888D
MSDRPTTQDLFAQFRTVLENLLTHVRGDANCGPGCIYNRAPQDRHFACLAYLAAANLLEQIRDRDVIVLDRPATHVSDVATTGIGMFSVQRGKVLYDSGKSRHLVEADLMLKIAAAIAIVAQRAASNPDPAHDLAIQLHEAICGGSPAGAEACDCMAYAETALRLLGAGTPQGVAGRG